MTIEISGIEAPERIKRFQFDLVFFIWKVTKAMWLKFEMKTPIFANIYEYYIKWKDIICFFLNKMFDENRVSHSNSFVK